MKLKNIFRKEIKLSLRFSHTEELPYDFVPSEPAVADYRLQIEDNGIGLTVSPVIERIGAKGIVKIEDRLLNNDERYEIHNYGFRQVEPGLWTYVITKQYINTMLATEGNEEHYFEGCSEEMTADVRYNLEKIELFLDSSGPGDTTVDKNFTWV